MSRFVKPVRPTTRMSFRGEQKLEEGDNYFWVTGTLKLGANISHTVGFTLDDIGFSVGTGRTFKTTPNYQRIGVAVRNGADDNVHTYRIPGLATTNRGTLIGVYDVRHRAGGDLPGDIDVGMSRSTDQGQTWEPMNIILDMGNDPEWRFDGVGDPSVLVDRETNTIWVTAN